MGWIAELQRRNVIRMAGLYLVVAADRFWPRAAVPAADASVASAGAGPPAAPP